MKTCRGLVNSDGTPVSEDGSHDEESPLKKKDLTQKKGSNKAREAGKQAAKAKKVKVKKAKTVEVGTEPVEPAGQEVIGRITRGRAKLIEARGE